MSKHLTIITAGQRRKALTELAQGYEERLKEVAWNEHLTELTQARLDDVRCEFDEIAHLSDDATWYAGYRS